MVPVVHFRVDPTRPREEGGEVTIERPESSLHRGRNLLRLLRKTRPYRRTLAIGITAGILVTAGSVMLPLFIRQAIDQAILRGESRRLVTVVATIVGVGVLRSVFHGTRRQIAGEVSIGVEADLRQALYEHVQALDMRYHQEISTGQIMSRASSDLQAIRNLIVFIPLSIGQTILLILAAVVMFSFDAVLAAISLASLPFLTVATQRFVKRFDDVTWRLQQKLADFASVIEETVTGIRVVKAFGREAHQVAILEREAAQIFDEAMESIRLRAWYLPLYNLLPQIGIVMVVWVGGHRVLAGRMSIGTLVAFNAYLLLLVWPLRTVGMVVANAQRASTASGRIFEVLDTLPGISDRPGAQPLEVRRGEVRFEGVTFSYPGGRAVLQGVDLVIEPGSSLALVGPTGCGKSTLAALLPRFIEPSSGRVLVDGVEISLVTLRSLRSQIGIVFEDTFLFSDTLRANIAFGRPEAPLDEVVRGAVVAKAHGFIDDLPDGYETVVGEQGYTLSGGQRQRVAIARAILMDPKLIILDDATSSVDVRMEKEILDGLREVMVGRTTLIVARRPSTASLAEQVAYMQAGRIVAIGTHDQLWDTIPGYRDAMTLGGTVDRLVDQVREGTP